MDLQQKYFGVFTRRNYESAKVELLPGEQQKQMRNMINILNKNFMQRTVILTFAAYTLHMLIIGTVILLSGGLRFILRELEELSLDVVMEGAKFFFVTWETLVLFILTKGCVLLLVPFVAVTRTFPTNLYEAWWWIIGHNKIILVTCALSSFNGFYVYLMLNKFVKEAYPARLFEYHLRGVRVSEFFGIYSAVFIYSALWCLSNFVNWRFCLRFPLLPIHPVYRFHTAICNSLKEILNKAKRMHKSKLILLVVAAAHVTESYTKYGNVLESVLSTCYYLILLCMCIFYAILTLEVYWILFDITMTVELPFYIEAVSACERSYSVYLPHAMTYGNTLIKYHAFHTFDMICFPRTVGCNLGSYYTRYSGRINNTLFDDTLSSVLRVAVEFIDTCSNYLNSVGYRDDLTNARIPSLADIKRLNGLTNNVDVVNRPSTSIRRLHQQNDNPIINNRVLSFGQLIAETPKLIWRELRNMIGRCFGRIQRRTEEVTSGFHNRQKEPILLNILCHHQPLIWGFNGLVVILTRARMYNSRPMFLPYLADITTVYIRVLMVLRRLIKFRDENHSCLLLSYNKSSTNIALDIVAGIRHGMNQIHREYNAYYDSLDLDLRIRDSIQLLSEANNNHREVLDAVCASITGVSELL